MIPTPQWDYTDTPLAGRLDTDTPLLRPVYILPSASYLVDTLKCRTMIHSHENVFEHNLENVRHFSENTVAHDCDGKISFATAKSFSTKQNRDAKNDFAGIKMILPWVNKFCRNSYYTGHRPL